MKTVNMNEYNHILQKFAEEHANQDENKKREYFYFDLGTTGPSDKFNPFAYIKNDIDIMRLASIIANENNVDRTIGDTYFLELMETSLLCALMAYLFHYRPKEEQTFSNLETYVRNAYVYGGGDKPPLFDVIFQELYNEHPTCFAEKMYENYNLADDKTYRSGICSIAMKLSAFNLDIISEKTNTDTFDFENGADRITLAYAIPTENKSLSIIETLFTSMINRYYNIAAMDNLENYGIKILYLSKKEKISHIDGTGTIYTV